MYKKKTVPTRTRLLPGKHGACAGGWAYAGGGVWLATEQLGGGSLGTGYLGGPQSAHLQQNERHRVSLKQECKSERHTVQE